MTSGKFDYRLAPYYHPSCQTHESYRLTCAEYRALQEAFDDRCGICHHRTPWMNIDHDHNLGDLAIRGYLCARCNVGHMRRVDSGERPLDAATAEYLRTPWYSVRQGKPLESDPVLHIRVSELSIADLATLDQYAWAGGIRSLQGFRPGFDHEGLRIATGAGDTRPALRLIQMRHYWGRPDLDIADTDPSVPGGTSLAQHIATRVATA